MRVEKFIDQNFLTTSPYSGIKSIKSKLLKRTYLVVFDESKYIGLLTIDDIINRPHKLVIDCLTLKKGIKSSMQIKGAAKIMEQEKAPILPVFKNNEFLGVLCYNQIIDSLTNMYVEGRKKEKINFRKKLSKDSEKIKTAFLNNISHEIRTPLNAIVGFSDLLTRNTRIDEDNKYFSNAIRENSADLLSTIEDLIEVSRIQSGTITIKKRKCSPKEIFTLLHNKFLLEKELRKKDKINLYYSIDERIQANMLYTDALRLKQVLEHLIKNALKFTSEGSVEFGCRLEDTKFILFYVRDTGIGIPDNRIEEVFNSFTKIEDDLNLHRGTGIGLSITKKVIELLGGEIWVESEQCSGTTFYFTIPLKTSDKKKQRRHFYAR